MISIKSLQDLVNSVVTIHSNVETAQHSISVESSSNTKSSEFHLRFDKLMNKFSVFANDYKHELEQFHKLLIGNINALKLQAEKERIEKERLAIEEKLETISNSNKEIINNLNIIENSPRPSSIKSYSTNNTTQRDESSPIPPVYTKKTQPKTPTKVNKKPVKSTKKVVKNTKKKNVRKSAPVHKPKTVVKNNIEREQKTNDNNNSDTMSVNGSVTSSFEWEFRGVARSSTRMFIGNIPSDIQRNTIEQWVRKIMPRSIKAYQISSMDIRGSARGKYVLIRFNNTVNIHKVKNFINKINNGCQQAYDMKKKELEQKQKKKVAESNKKGKRMMNKAISNREIYEAISWKKQVFAKFYKNFSYNNDDGVKTNTVYIRNFDILDKNCHFELTQKLLGFGQLVRNVYISCDKYGDPYAIATFGSIDDAVWCCTSEIEFNGRVLEMRYFR